MEMAPQIVEAAWKETLNLLLLDVYLIKHES